MFAIASILAAMATAAHAAGVDPARDQVWASETAFARTMSERKLQAFGEFLADDAVFFDTGAVLRGKNEILQAWSKLFSDPEPPFSWEPDQVEVLASGTLALSTGPVRNSAGKIVARFNTIWRLEAPNRWKVVFDKGSPPSPGPH